MTATPTNKRNTSVERTPPIRGKAATPKMKDIQKQNKQKNSVKTFFLFLFVLFAGFTNVFGNTVEKKSHSR